MPPDTDGPTVFRPGGISYVRIPAPTPELASFYRDVFGWRVGGLVAVLRDPAGNVVGAWQNGPRH